MNPARILFVFATRAEADPLMAAGGEAALATSTAAHFHAYGRTTDWLVTGMGPEAAARSVRAALVRERPAMVINAGIAGALHPGFGIGDVVEVAAAAHAQVEHPGHREFLALSASRPDWWPRDLRRGRLLTRATPLFDPEEASRLATRADLVDMEGAAVAEVCAEAEIPCLLIKAVSDFADDRATLLSNLAGASHALAQVLRAAFGQASLSGVMP